MIDELMATRIGDGGWEVEVEVEVETGVDVDAAEVDVEAEVEVEVEVDDGGGVLLHFKNALEEHNVLRSDIPTGCRGRVVWRPGK